MYDYCDAGFYKQHSLFQMHPNALQFIIYFDEIEVANPLGSRAGVHKLGQCVISKNHVYMLLHYIFVI